MKQIEPKAQVKKRRKLDEPKSAEKVELMSPLVCKDLGKKMAQFSPQMKCSSFDFASEMSKPKFGEKDGLVK